MKTFMDIFDTDEVKKYVKMMDEKAKAETEKEVNQKWEQHINNEILPKLISYQNQLHEIKLDKLNFEIETLKEGKDYQAKYNELIGLLLVVILFAPERERENILNNLAPKNKETIMNELNNLDSKVIMTLKQRMQKRINN